MSHLLFGSYVVMVLCVFAGLKTLETAANALSPDQRHALRGSFRMSGLALVVAISPIAVGYILIDRYPQHAVPIILVAVSALVLFQCVSYVYGVRKVRRLKLPTSYVRSFKLFHLVVNIGFTAVIAANLFALAYGAAKPQFSGAAVHAAPVLGPATRPCANA